MQDLSDLNGQMDDSAAAEDALFNSPELLGKECQGCFKALSYNFFDRDSSSKDGRGMLCASCKSTPRLSIDENTARVREANLRSHAIKRQRWEHQEELKNDAARRGRPMHSDDLLAKLRKYIPDLYVMPGNIEGDLAVFRIYPGPQLRLEGRDYEYLFYWHRGVMKEFSTYEFQQDKDIPIREKRRGWRTPLLRLIKAKLLTEENVNKEFGPAEGEGSSRWHRELYKFRNTAAPAA